MWRQLVLQLAGIDQALRDAPGWSSARRPFTIAGTLEERFGRCVGVSATTGIISAATVAGTGIPAGTSMAALGMYVFGNVDQWLRRRDRHC